MSKDTLYKNSPEPADFTFNAKVAEVFEDMLSRSVPCYSQVIEMASALLEKFTKQGDTVYDLGCSTGTTLLEMSRRLNHLNLNFIGVDSSLPMIAKATLKTEMFSRQDNVRFITGDIAETPLEPCGACILNYTLQFIRPMVRRTFLTRLHDCLRPGGILILSEKTISPAPDINRAYIDFYHDFKRNQGYSETEIAKKRESLENILIPFSIQENIALAHKAGFSHVEPFFQWFNFVSFVAIKDS